MTTKKNLLNTFLLFALSISFFTLTSCGSGGKADSSSANIPAGMVAVDLSPYGMQALVNAPDSTVAPMEVTENPLGGADIKVGMNFQITVIEGEGDIALMKQDATNDDIRKFIKYVVDEPNVLVWEWQIEGMEPEFRFYTIVKDGGKSFIVRDVEGEIFSEKAIMQMLDAAKSVRIKAPAKVDA